MNSTVCPQHGAQPCRGFTLVELLVAMSLLSLVMLALVSALRTAAQTEERVDRKLQSADELRLVSSFLREVLGRISVQKTPLVKQAGDSPYFFRGEPNEISWLGVLPARHGVGGRHHLRLFLSSTPTGRAQAQAFCLKVCRALASNTSIRKSSLRAGTPGGQRSTICPTGCVCRFGLRPVNGPTWWWRCGRWWAVIRPCPALCLAAERHDESSHFAVRAGARARRGVGHGLVDRGRAEHHRRGLDPVGA